jgi:CHAT domain-containing protein
MGTLLLSVGMETAGYYPVQLFADSAGPDWQTHAVVSAQMPVSLADPAGLWDETRLRGVVHGGTSHDRESAGAYLYALLAGGDLGPAWKARRTAGTTTILDIVPAKLRCLPWELLFDDLKFLANDAERPLFRRFTPDATETDTDALPLRVLLVIGAKDDEDEPDEGRRLGWTAEVRAMRRMHRQQPAKMDLEELLRPTRQEIADVYRWFRPHVFHFIGHGHVDNGEAALRIWNGQTYDDWTPTEIVTDLDGWRVPVAILNACRSADAQATQSSYDIASTFARIGARCTIAMQSDIDGAVAAAFAKGVYEKIVDGAPVHCAVAKTRVEISRTHGMNSDWPVPVLQLCCSPDSALPRRSLLAQDVSEEVVGAREFEDLGQFVDRTKERRSLCGDEETSPKRLLVIYGDSGQGKTFLLKWCTRHFALRNFNVRYVDFADTKNKTFRDALTDIRKGDGKTSLLTGRLDDGAFAAFDARMTQITTAAAPTEDYLATISDLFRQALADVARTRPLLLCLDHLVNAALIPGEHRFLKQHLVEPVASGGVPNVRLLLTVAASTLQGDLRWLAGISNSLKLDPWDDATFEWFARAALDDLFNDDDRSAEFLIDIARRKHLPKDKWPPSFLAWFHDKAKGMLS